jgi:hypothetical protein
MAPEVSKMSRFAALLLCLTIAFPLLADEGFSSLEEQMTGKEFSAAGLHKLSQAELDALNAWIRGRSLATLDKPAATAAVAASAAEPGKDMRGFEGEEEREPITSRLLGTFDGWDGQTVFRLENGMIWVQDDKDKFYVRAIENPVVVIDPGMFGTWRLQVEGFSSECKVKRIQ